MKEFVSENAARNLGTPKTDVEVVRVYSYGKKCDITSQPMTTSPFKSHMHVIAYIQGHKFVVSERGLEERGLEQVPSPSAQDEWKARTERAENLAAARLTELHARSEEISRVAEERDDLFTAKGKKISSLNSELYAQSEELSRVIEELERTRDRVSTLNNIVNDFGICRTAPDPDLKFKFANLHGVGVAGAGAGAGAGPGPGVAASKNDRKVIAILKSENRRLNEDIEALNQLRGTITSASTWETIAKNRMKHIKILRDNIEAAQKLLQYREDES